jgi:ATP-binding cassette subfamily B (MDR/TAP) protein 1
MLYIATGVFLVSMANIILFSVFSENIAYRIRLMYFKRCLEKDASYYDEHNPAEMASRIIKECSSINRGTGDKIGVIFQSISSIVCGFTFAFYWGY